MEAEFSRGTGPEREVVAVAHWRDGDVAIESQDEVIAQRLARAFRRVPVVTEDASHRRLGTHGEVVLQPGDLEWFRAVAFTRATAETGLAARLVPGVAEGGYDPAGDYRTFEQKVVRLVPRARPSD